MLYKCQQCGEEFSSFQDCEGDTCNRCGGCIEQAESVKELCSYIDSCFGVENNE